MKDFLKVAVVLVLILGTAGGLVACEVKIWKECRDDHGVLYCMRTLG